MAIGASIPHRLSPFLTCPSWFGDNRDFPGLAPGLLAAGMTEVDVAGLLGGNWMKFWQEAFVKP
jgi:membrane dipeptidase